MRITASQISETRPHCARSEFSFREHRRDAILKLGVRAGAIFLVFWGVEVGIKYPSLNLTGGGLFLMLKG